MNDTPADTAEQPVEHPTTQHVVQTYRQVLRRIVEAIRQGTAHARWYFDYMDEDIDNGLAPALVRKGARRDLIAVGADVSNEEDAPNGNDPHIAAPETGQPEFLSNLGLAVTADGVRIRILRSNDGDIPVPGPSKARQAFYSQQLYLPGLELAMPNPPSFPSDVTHCVLHWDTDEEYNLTRVYLALPLAGNTTRESVQVLWNEIIWRRHAHVDGAQVEAETIDQDIYLEGEETGTA